MSSNFSKFCLSSHNFPPVVSINLSITFSPLYFKLGNFSVDGILLLLVFLHSLLPSFPPILNLLGEKIRLFFSFLCSFKTFGFFFAHNINYKKWTKLVLSKILEYTRISFHFDLNSLSIIIILYWKSIARYHFGDLFGDASFFNWCSGISKFDVIPNHFFAVFINAWRTNIEG